MSYRVFCRRQPLIRAREGSAKRGQDLLEGTSVPAHLPITAAAAILTALGVLSLESPPGLAGGRPAHAAGSLSPFVGTWTGHTRRLTVSSSGIARETLDDGCCTKIARVTYRLSGRRGSGNVVTARARITKVTILEPDAFGDGKYELRRPRVGMRTRFRLNRRSGVLTIQLNKITYCNAEAASHSRCGA